MKARGLICLSFNLMLIGNVVAQEPKSATTPEWRYVKKDDPLHAKVIDGFVLDGVYLTPPAITAEKTPSIVVRCSAGKVEKNYFDVGAVVDLTRVFEARIDGKEYNMYPSDVGTSGTSVFFPKIDLKRILEARQVLIGVSEHLGPQIVMRFDIPDPSLVMEKCGDDKVLRWRGGLHRK